LTFYIITHPAAFFFSTFFVAAAAGAGAFPATVGALFFGGNGFFPTNDGLVLLGDFFAAPITGLFVKINFFGTALLTAVGVSAFVFFTGVGDAPRHLSLRSTFERSVSFGPNDGSSKIFFH
jgi:hypothetical protein